MPVATRIRKVPRLSVPRNQVTRNDSDRFLILTEDRCRNTFCWTASARCRLVGPKPLRKIERQTRVSRRFASFSASELATSGPHELLLTEGLGAIDQKVPILVDPSPQPGQRVGRRTLDLDASAGELAAMARARDNTQFRLPGGQATQMRADGRLHRARPGRH